VHAFSSSNDAKEYVEITGNTLLVYFYLLRKRHSCGVREIQKALGFSSSSTAHYHLDKLVHSGILTRDSYGNYSINKNKRAGQISSFFVVHGFIFPRQLVYAVATSLMCLFFLTFFWNFLTLTLILALLPGLVASGIFWYDAIKLWSSLPSFKKQRSIISENRSNA
jgi:hypothetical protein